MFDIDRFKTINDEMGHLVGDYTLRELAACVRKMVRREDLFSRYGGEEFVVVLVETNRKQALEAAERIRLLVEKYNFRFEEQAFNLTVSIGVAECPTDGSASAVELIKKADENLYEAKHAGRNRSYGVSGSNRNAECGIKTKKRFAELSAPKDSFDTLIGKRFPPTLPSPRDGDC